MKRIFSLLLTLMLVFTLALPASAASVGTVTYWGREKGFTFGPGSEYSASDLFPNFKGVMPGDQATQQITVKYRGSAAYKVKIYMRALGAHPDSKEFLSQLTLAVQKDGGTPLLFLAPADERAQLTEWTLLGTYYTGGTATLDVTLDVPITLGNEFQEEVGYLDWEFMVEEIPLDVTNPKTGDYIVVAVAVLAVSAAALAVLFLIARKKKKK